MIYLVCATTDLDDNGPDIVRASVVCACLTKDEAEAKLETLMGSYEILEVPLHAAGKGRTALLNSADAPCFRSELGLEP